MQDCLTVDLTCSIGFNFHEHKNHVSSYIPEEDFVVDYDFPRYLSYFSHLLLMVDKVDAAPTFSNNYDRSSSLDHMYDWGNAYE